MSGRWDQKEDLETLAQVALDQILDKKYETEFRGTDISAVIRMGIAFRGKEVIVKNA